MSPTLIAGAVAATIIGGLGLYAWDADKALDRDQKKLVAAELRADSFAKGLTQCRTEIAEKNRIILDATNLPEVRKRLCARFGPTSGCCQPEPAECKP